MHIIVKGNTHPLNGNYYCQKSRGSVTLKGKKKKGLLLLLHVLHGNDSHHFLLDVRDLCVDLTNHVIHSSLIVFVNKRQSEEANPCQDDQGHHIEPGSNIGQSPQTEDELESIKDALQEEESPELHD